MKCKICEINDANATGSHIVPHFLLKRIDNEDGSTKRDKEMGFVISENNPSSYFGRGTSIEKLKEVYGEITDELIQNNSIPLIEDNIFCTACEKKLSIIESEYSKTLDIQNSEILNYQSSEASFISFLFWSSIIWRISIAPKSGFALKKSDEKRLQRILSKYLKPELKKIKPFSKDSDLQNIGYKLLRSHNYSKANPTVLFCHPKYRKPYYFLIDEFILIFHIRRHYNINTAQNDLNLNNELKKSILNTPFQGEKIKNIKSETIDKLKEYFYLKVSENYLQNFTKEIDLVHNRLGGTGKLPIKIKEEIVKEMISDETIPLGLKYTTGHKAQTIFKVLGKYIKTNES